MKKKRSIETDEDLEQRKREKGKGGEMERMGAGEGEEDEEFEDAFEDEVEEEEVARDHLLQEDEEVQEVEDEELLQTARPIDSNNVDFNEIEFTGEPGDGDGGGGGDEARIWIPGVDGMEEGEELRFESSAYDLMHPLLSEWPCLSFDIVSDSHGGGREKFPHTVSFVAGSQADRATENRLYVIKLSQLARTKFDSDSEGMDDGDDEGTQDDPVVEHFALPHTGAVNRLRLMRGAGGGRHVAATWAETGKVHVWDLSPWVQALDEPGSVVPPAASEARPLLQTFGGHGAEGFAMDWSATVPGRLLTGDCGGAVHMWQPTGSGWAVDSAPFVGHGGSVEDLQWSPNEDTVFASCSVDGHVRIWDVRMKQKPGMACHAHPGTDVNVISWHQGVSYLLVSGADDGRFSSWDLRNFRSGTPAASFQWHRGAITSIEWSPHDESMLTVAGEDNQATTWDLSLEADAEAEEGAGLAHVGQREDVQKIPPQLLFVHMTRDELKEVHWHPQIPGLMISTAADGFNVYKPYNIHELP